MNNTKRENRKKLKKIVDKYVSKIVCGTGWTIDKYKNQMINKIEKIITYKKGK